MPSQHENRAITPRPPEDLRARSYIAVAQIGMTLNAWILASLRYLVGESDDMPPRPDRAVVLPPGWEPPSKAPRRPRR